MKKIVFSMFALTLALTMLVTPVFAGGPEANWPDNPEQLGPVQQQGYLASNGRLLKSPPIHYRLSPVEIEERPCSCGGTLCHRSTIHLPWEVFGEYVRCTNGYGDHLDTMKKQKIIVRYQCDTCQIIEQDISYALYAFCVR